jgi:hypothetical protein
VLYYLRKHNLHTITNSEAHEYNTRRKDYLLVQKCNTVTCKKGIKVYNKLPPELRKLKGEKKFKKNLKMF